MALKECKGGLRGKTAGHSSPSITSGNSDESASFLRDSHSIEDFGEGGERCGIGDGKRRERDEGKVFALFRYYNGGTP